MMRNFLISGSNRIWWGAIIASVALTCGILYFGFFGISLLLGALVLIIAGDWLLFHKERLLVFIAAMIPISVTAEGIVAVHFPSEILAGILAMVLLFGVSKKKVNNGAILKHPITLWLIAEFTWMGIASISSTMPEVSFKRFAVRGVYLITFYYLMVVFFQNPRQAVKVWLVYGFAIVIVVVSAFWNHLPYNLSAAASIYLAKPFFPEHTMYGSALAFILPFILLLFIRPWLAGPRTKHIRWVLGILLAFLLLGVFLAYSRASWLSLGFTLFMLGLFKLRTRFSMLMLMLSLLLGGLWLFQEPLVKKIKENEAVSYSGGFETHIKSVANIQTDASNLERINRWSCAWRMFLDKPVFGFGPGTYQFQYGSYQLPEELTTISTFDGDRGNAHSEYLTPLSESGLVGLGLFLGVFLTAFYRGMHLIYFASQKSSRLLAQGALLGLSTFLFHGFFNSFIDSDKIAFLVFGSLAIITALEIREKQFRQRSKHAPVS